MHLAFYFLLIKIVCFIRIVRIKYVENIAFNDTANRVGLLVHIELPSKYEVGVFACWNLEMNYIVTA